ncbi:Hsp20/alpha crystallin family protein [Taklimakanibacter deserti]|uniref:Hsp20/alpha crystallin family protein n=1 Tax=Taklimakanibacter deserti TaxID=2267839 RepID=UPI000E65107C
MTQSVTKVPVTKEERAGRQDLALAPLQNLQREVNQLFDQFDRGWRPFFRSPIFDYVPMARLESYWAAPAVDIRDTERSYEIAAEVPGIGPDNLDVRIVDGRLLIKGDKKDSWEKNGGGCHLSERHYGAFERSFPLPEGIDPDKIEASLSSGVLTVVVPKGTATQKDSRKIEVKAA